MRNGNKMQYRKTIPIPHKINKYQFQFHGSGIFFLKHFEKSSSTITSIPFAR